MTKLPRWADVVLVPLISLLLAAIISGLVIVAIGGSPWEAVTTMVNGALGSPYAWGYTLYYATSFVFTGLAVTVAFHAGMFNIGGEGQAQLGGLGVAVMLLYIPWPHWTIALIAAMLGAALFGAIWAAIPAWLQARRGSHIVITTIMFNYIAGALLIYLLVNVMIDPKGGGNPATVFFPEATQLPRFDEIPLLSAIFTKKVPANVSFFIALLACVGVYLLLWQTRLGYQLRAFGKSEPAAVYAGISPYKVIMTSMIISGALAGMMAINNVMGESSRLINNSAEGAGFIGIAVALMGRNHPIGVFLAAILFGFLYQGGAELGMWTNIPIELRTVVQGLVILFTGALDQMVRMMLGVFFRSTRQEV